MMKGGTDLMPITKKKSVRKPISSQRVRIQKRQSWIAGWKEGFFRGREKLVATKFEGMLKKIMFNKNICFLRSPWRDPFNAIDDAIENTLKNMVSCVTVASCNDFFAPLVVEAKPDLVFMFNTAPYSDHVIEQVNQIRKHSIPLAIWMPDDPYFIVQNLAFSSHFDYVFTLDRSCVPLYEKQGCTTYYLPFCAFPFHFYPLGKQSRFQKKVRFVGSGSRSRIDFFDPIMAQLKKWDIQIVGPNWGGSNHFQSLNIFDTHFANIVETNTLYNETKISLNIHKCKYCSDYVDQPRNDLVALSPNPRTFEICATGSFQLTDVREDLHQFYIPGVEIETYSSREELLEKIDYYFVHEEQRYEIALRGLERTLKEHTYEHRLNKMLNIIFPEEI